MATSISAVFSFAFVSARWPWPAMTSPPDKQRWAEGHEVEHGCAERHAPTASSQTPTAQPRQGRALGSRAGQTSNGGSCACRAEGCRRTGGTGGGPGRGPRRPETTGDPRSQAQIDSSRAIHQRDPHVNTVKKQSLVLAHLLVMAAQKLCHSHNDVDQRLPLLLSKPPYPVIGRGNASLQLRALVLIRFSNLTQRGPSPSKIKRPFSAEGNTATTGYRTHCDKRRRNQGNRHWTSFPTKCAIGRY